jgi:hypothetical protein
MYATPRVPHILSSNRHTTSVVWSAAKDTPLQTKWRLLSNLASGGTSHHSFDHAHNPCSAANSDEGDVKIAVIRS